jgi:hypothetical protein
MRKEMALSLVVVAILCSLLLAFVRADSVILKSGEVLRGDVTLETPDEVRLRMPWGVSGTIYDTKVITRSEIAEVIRTPTDGPRIQKPRSDAPASFAREASREPSARDSGDKLSSAFIRPAGVSDERALMGQGERPTKPVVEGRDARTETRTGWKTAVHERKAAPKANPAELLVIGDDHSEKTYYSRGEAAVAPIYDDGFDVDEEGVASGEWVKTLGLVVFLGFVGVCFLVGIFNHLFPSNEAIDLIAFALKRVIANVFFGSILGALAGFVLSILATLVFNVFSFSVEDSIFGWVTGAPVAVGAVLGVCRALSGLRAKKARYESDQVGEVAESDAPDIDWWDR